MSRSIHETRKQLRELAANSAELSKVEKQLARKRNVKDAISTSRRSAPPPTSTTVPIRVLDSGPHVVHAASPEDIEAISLRLPPGTTDGLSEIVLSLGEHSQLEGSDAHIWDPDPITGRIGGEVLPGIYKGWIWGTYQHPSCRIDLYAFVVDPQRPSLIPTAAYCKLQMLATFVHEAAHHFDHTRRVARGRWRADDKTKVESFADQCEYEWDASLRRPLSARDVPARRRGLARLAPNPWQGPLHTR